MAKKLEYWARVIIIAIVVYAVCYGTFVSLSQHRAKRTQSVFVEEISSICDVTVVDENTWEFTDPESVSVDSLNSLIEIYYKYDLKYKDHYQYYYMAKPFFNLIQLGIDSITDVPISELIELDELQDDVNTLRVQYSLSWKYEDSYMRATAQAIGLLAIILYLLFAWVYKLHS